MRDTLEEEFKKHKKLITEIEEYVVNDQQLNRNAASADKREERAENLKGRVEAETKTIVNAYRRNLANIARLAALERAIQQDRVDNSFRQNVIVDRTNDKKQRIREKEERILKELKRRLPPTAVDITYDEAEAEEAEAEEAEEEEEEHEEEVKDEKEKEETTRNNTENAVSNSSDTVASGTTSSSSSPQQSPPAPIYGIGGNSFQPIAVIPRPSVSRRRGTPTVPEQRSTTTSPSDTLGNMSLGDTSRPMNTSS